MPYESNPPRRSGKVVRLRHRHDIAGAFDYLGDSFPKHPAQVFEETRDRMRLPPSPWSGRVDINIEPLPPPRPPPERRLAPEIESNRAAYDHLVTELSSQAKRSERYKYETAWGDCHKKFGTLNRDFRKLWPPARVAAGLPERARRPRKS
jgi:hypothetical protein